MEKIEAEKLWSKVRQQLLNVIKAMTPPENRLPSEEELAVRIGISRATVREALHSLIKDGYVTKRHGKGNFGHPSAIAMMHRIDISGDFNQLFKSGTEAVKCHVMNRQLTTPDLKAASALGIPESGELAEREIYRQDWLYSTMDRNLAYCIISIPGEIIKSGLPDDSKPDLESWMLKHCGKDIAYFSTSLKGGIDPPAALALGLSEKRHMQIWDELVYDIHDTPVCFIEVFFHPDNAELTMAVKLHK